MRKTTEYEVLAGRLCRQFIHPVLCIAEALDRFYPDGVLIHGTGKDVELGYVGHGIDLCELDIRRGSILTLLSVQSRVYSGGFIQPRSRLSSIAPSRSIL